MADPLTGQTAYQRGGLFWVPEQRPGVVETQRVWIPNVVTTHLGCVLAETGQPELALAAFEGALAYHRDYPDVHYHLARTLDDLDRRDEADLHWRIFLELSADSPWATAACQRLGLETVEE